MSEQMPPTAPPPEKDARAVVLLLDRLYHGQFDTVMSTTRHAEFMDFLRHIGADKGNGGVAEIIIQFCISETAEDFAKQDSIHWAGLVLDTVFSEAGATLESKQIVAPKDNRDILDIEALRDMSCFTLEWADIDWGQFNWQADAHEQHPDFD